MKTWAILLAATLACACGKDETAKKNSSTGDAGVNNTTSDTGINNVGGDTGLNNVGGDTGADAASDTGADASVPGDSGADMPPTSCGDGVLDPGEQCDDGALNDDTGNGTCRTDCMSPTCGDGVVDFVLRETCDDRNTAPGDGCSATCTRETPATCGDGSLDAGEQCDNGARNSDQAPNACRTDCTDAACGDGVADIGEECDDGNLRAGDGCSATCTAEVGAGCGDGNLDLRGGEECDDGNMASGDGCSSTCQLETAGASCGDNALDARERCDDGNTTNGDGCNPTCNLRGDVTTLLPAVSGAGAIAAAHDRLWVAGDFRLGYVMLDTACLTNNNCSVVRAAGTGVQGHMDAADGATALVGFVESMATDGQTVWFFDAQTLRAMSTTAPYAVTTVAGDIAAAPNNCVTQDGIGTAAGFYGTRGLTYYNGMLYFLDGCTGVLRTVDPTTYEVKTIAGTQWTPANPAEPMCPMGAPANYTCGAGAAADGYGLAGAMVSPRYMTSDNAGMLYITDTNGQTLRTYNTVTGYLGTLAGGTVGYVDGIGTMAQISRPRGLASDGTSLYFAEQTQNTVRQVEVANASVTTLAGRRGCAGGRDGLGGTGMTVNCNNNPLGQATFDTPFNVVYHFPSRSLYVRDSNGLRRIE